VARRKQRKKAQYQEFPNCLHYDTPMVGKWASHFGNAQPITFELGCGHGTFVYELALRHPGRNFVGIDLKTSRMWRSGKKALEENVSNVAFLCQHLIRIEDSVAPQEADELWITFPDPYEKKRQAKHRMINRPFLEAYRKVLKPDGKLHFKTDNLDLFHYALEVFVRTSFVQLEELSFDLHGTEHILDDAKIQTEYEKQFLAMGKSINYTRISFLTG
jgi:tRNA (guanine-N7-)-methyltransferase